MKTNLKIITGREKANLMLGPLQLSKAIFVIIDSVAYLKL
jgi:hypothetical protein